MYIGAVQGLELFLLGRRLMKLGEQAIEPSHFHRMPASVRMVMLDAFENPIYDLQLLDLIDGQRAWSYVCASDIGSSETSWDAETFSRDHLTSYVKRCTAWRQTFKPSATTAAGQYGKDAQRGSEQADRGW